MNTIKYFLVLLLFSTSAWSTSAALAQTQPPPTMPEQQLAPVSPGALPSRVPLHESVPNQQGTAADAVDSTATQAPKQSSVQALKTTSTKPQTTATVSATIAGKGKGGIAAAGDRRIFWLHGLNENTSTWSRYNDRFYNERVLDYTPTLGYASDLQGGIPGKGYDIGIAEDVSYKMLPFVPSASKLNKLPQPSNDKLPIVIGHSMGGLVARTIEQQLSETGYGSIFKDRKLFGAMITVGTPNQGADAITSVYDGTAYRVLANGALELSNFARTVGPFLAVIGFLLGAIVAVLFPLAQIVGNIIGKMEELNTLLFQGFQWSTALIAAGIVGTIAALFTPIVIFGIDLTKLFLPVHIIETLFETKLPLQCAQDMRPGNPYLTSLNTFTSTQSITPRIGIYGEADYHSELRLASTLNFQNVYSFPTEADVKDDYLLNQVEHFESALRTTRDVLVGAAVVGGIVSFFVPAVAPVAFAAGVAAASFGISANYISSGLPNDWKAIIHSTKSETRSYYYEELVYDCPANYHGAAWHCPSHLEGHTGYYQAPIEASDDGLLSRDTQQMPGVGPDFNLKAQGANHITETYHQSVSSNLNRIFDRTDNNFAFRILRRN